MRDRKATLVATHFRGDPGARGFYTSPVVCLRLGINIWMGFIQDFGCIQAAGNLFY